MYKKKILLVVLACLVLYPIGTVAQYTTFPDDIDMKKLKWVTPAASAPRLQHRTFYSATAKSEVSYHIYTPDRYDTEAERRFPVLYWLHGSGGDVAKLPQIVKHFDEAIRAEKMPPVLIVFPNGMANSMWCDSKNGKVPMETVVVKELVPHIDVTYRTIASREGRLIEGFSMGGYGAARLGFKYPLVFGAVSMLGAGPLQQEFSESIGPRHNARARVKILKTVYGGDQEYFKSQSPWVLAEQHADAVRGKTQVRQLVGDRDEMLDANRDFHTRLTRLEIPHSFQVLPGVDHNPLALFNALGNANWGFYGAVSDVKTSSTIDHLESEAAPSELQDNSVRAQRRGSPDVEQRRRIIRRLKTFDRDGDGVIHLGDVPVKARAAFQRVDTNRDGRIDLSELTAFQQ